MSPRLATPWLSDLELLQVQFNCRQEWLITGPELIWLQFHGGLMQLTSQACSDLSQILLWLTGHKRGTQRASVYHRTSEEGWSSALNYERF